MAQPVIELTARAREVFRLVVESYLETGSPVGSRTLSQLPGLNISPASIRGVMQDLEELGLLGHPHTSAGRVPTETGLRLFVDGMMQAAEPSAEERAAIEARVGQGGPIEEALGAATAALSGLSACAGIVLVPNREPVLRQFGFVPLGQGQALAVLVGAVCSRTASLAISPSVPKEPVNSLARSYPATFLITFPPDCATVPSESTTVTPTTRSRMLP